MDKKTGGGDVSSNHQTKDEPDGSSVPASGEHSQTTVVPHGDGTSGDGQECSGAVALEQTAGGQDKGEADFAAFHEEDETPGARETAGKPSRLEKSRGGGYIYREESFKRR